MDKREDETLETEESEDLEDVEYSNDSMELPATLMGDNEPDEPELEPETEPEPKLAAKTEKELDRAELEREIRAQIAAERRLSLQTVKKVSIVCTAVILVLGLGLFAFLQLTKPDTEYIMRFDRQKISVEDFKFVMVLNLLNQTAYDKKSAIDGLTDFLILDKAAKDRKIELTDDEKNYVKSSADSLKGYLESNNVSLPKISDERIEELVSVDMLYYKLLESVAEEKGFAVDETDLAAEFAKFNASDKLLKYIVTNTEEEAQSAREALGSTLSVDDAIKHYSIAYESNGTEPVLLSQLGLDEDKQKAIMALKASEFSDVISLGEIYAVFIAVPEQEAKERFRSQYANGKKYQLFNTEYELWKSEAKVAINQKLFDEFDERAFFEEIYG